VTSADLVVLEFHGDLTIEEAPVLRDRLLESIRSGALVVVLDMTDVAYVDQAAMGVLMGARERLLASEGELRLAAVQAPVARVLRLLGLDASLPVYESVDAAREQPRLY
jgi:anti-sigma B factor antagonist